MLSRCFAHLFKETRFFHYKVVDLQRHAAYRHVGAVENALRVVNTADVDILAQRNAGTLIKNTYPVISTSCQNTFLSVI